MDTKFRKPLTTLLSKSNKPLSDKERAQLGKEWAERTRCRLMPGGGRRGNSLHNGADIS